MKKIMIIVLAGLVSCTGQQTTDQHATSPKHNEKAVVVPSDNGKKWKADEATKKNVAAMLQVVRDTAYADAGKRMQLYTSLQAKTDLLVKECSMKGAEHDALHVWLEKVLRDMKELKEEDEVYNETFAALKKDIAAFYQSFE